MTNSGKVIYFPKLGIKISEAANPNHITRFYYMNKRCNIRQDNPIKKIPRVIHKLDLNEYDTSRGLSLIKVNGLESICRNLPRIKSCVDVDISLIYHSAFLGIFLILDVLDDVSNKGIKLTTAALLKATKIFG